MGDKARICIIGNGRFANTVHYPALASLGNVDIAGICAFDKDRLKQTAEKFNIDEKRIFVARSDSDYQNMLEDIRPDGVYVIGQPEKMYDIWLWCLENGYNLFIEKPMGITIHQARALLFLAETKHCITQVSHQRRSSPLLIKMKEECLKKGPLTQASVEFYKFDIAAMHGARDRMLDDYTHAVDTARWICGGEVVKIESYCRRIIVPDINWIGATLCFDNGISCFVIGNWTSGRRVFRVSMHAPGIWAETDPEKEAFLYTDGNYEGIRFDARETAGSSEFYVYGGFQRKSIEFIDSILTGVDQTSSPFRDTVKTMEICEKILAMALLDGS
jgi:virulence factor